jgi:hypothetical protein
MKRVIVFSLLFLIPALALIAFSAARPAASAPAGVEAKGVGAAWYNPDWHYRRPITVTNTTSAQTDYQVRVTLDSTYDFDHTSSTGSDLRITASDGTTDLAFWIDRWDSIAKTATVWVRVPSLQVGTTLLYVYFGNSTAPSASNRKMTFTAYDGFEDYASGSLPTGSGYSNLNPGEWARYAGNPILQGTTGQWDASGATFASVIYDSAATPPFRMYYHGWGGTGCSGTCIGLATSPDGQVWTKYGTSPVLTPGGSGAWDVSGVRVPMVWKEGPSDYRMIYTGNGGGGFQVGYATSTDGITWTKSGSNPVFNDSNAWAHNSSQNWGVIKVGTDYLMWYGNSASPRQASIATSTDLIHWTPYASTPIFSSSGDVNDWRYSQFSLFTFTYGGYYYVLVPSYNSASDYARYYMYRSSSPYFPTNDRVLVRVAHLAGPTGAWDALDGDTPMVLTLDIQRSQFYNNQLWVYYAGSTAAGVWREGLLIEPNLATALYGAPVGPWGSFSWTITLPPPTVTPTPLPTPTPSITPAPSTTPFSASVVNTPVYQGNQSIRLRDVNASGAISFRGNFPQMTQGVVAVWMRRSADLPATNDDYDVYVYGDAGGNILKAAAGLGGNSRRYHYWTYLPTPGTRSFVDTGVTWSVDTWYLVSLAYNTDTDKYNFVVYDEAMNVLVNVQNIDFGYTATYINSAMLYTGSTYVGDGFGDNYLVRKYISPEPTVAMRSYSDFQEQVQVTGAGPLSLPYTGAGIDVGVQGNLSYIQVIRYNYAHPNAPTAQKTVVKRYWEIYPNWNASGYTASLTLHHPNVPDNGDTVCFYVSGTTWDCAASSFDPATGTITRGGITQFSEWTTQEDFDPLVVTIKNFSAASSTQLLIPGLFAASLVLGLIAVGLLWRSRKRTLH